MEEGRDRMGHDSTTLHGREGLLLEVTQGFEEDMATTPGPR